MYQQNANQLRLCRLPLNDYECDPVTFLLLLNNKLLLLLLFTDCVFVDSNVLHVSDLTLGQLSRMCIIIVRVEIKNRF